MYDKLSFLKGLALGLAGKPLEFAPGKEPVPDVPAEPVAYLYNGMRFPKLPVLDGYEYVVIWEGTLAGFSHAFCSSIPWTTTVTNIGQVVLSSGGAEYIHLYCYTEEYEHGAPTNGWVEHASPTGTGDVPRADWTSHTILNTDESIYLERTDPIPVYE